MFKIDVILNLPRHSRVSEILSYQHSTKLKPGCIVRVPLGKQLVIAVVITCSEIKNIKLDYTIREIAEVFNCLPALDENWLKLTKFTANYYQRSWGELATSALPSQLKTITNQQLEQRISKLIAKIDKTTSLNTQNIAKNGANKLTKLQTQVVEQINSTSKPVLLFGVTGSGKTEVYLQLVQQILAADPQSQALIMVPEINLTPQLLQRFRNHFTPQWGEYAVIGINSSMTPIQRLNNWLLMHLAKSRILLGTRLTILSSIPNLKLIIVDEEHDTSYKQQDGARYSARDLAVYRHKLLLNNNSTEQLSHVVLGSATPSLESWHAAKTDKYQLVQLNQRIGNIAMPQVIIVDMHQQQHGSILSPLLIEAIKQRVMQQQQVLLLLNRRGYSHILYCKICNWKSECPNCSVFRPYHKSDNSLRCHHCGSSQSAPQFCPACSSPELEQLGQGTEFLEEQLQHQLSQLNKADSSPVQICRIDTDSTSKKGSLEKQLSKMHSGETDILIGTQMITKGHDFRRVTLVAAINPDQMLFSSDFRAPEQLFALLEQAAGRAGRSASFLEQHQQTAQMLIQTQYPQHAIFASLQQHDYEYFANTELKQRQQAMLPPFTHNALLRCDARSQQQAQDFLKNIKHKLQAKATEYGITLYSVIPTYIQRVAKVERAQLLIESTSRQSLHQFLLNLTIEINKQKKPNILRWFIDIDPLSF